MIGWCSECFGLQVKVTAQQPLVSAKSNLRLRRAISSRVNHSDDSDDDDVDESNYFDDDEDTRDEYIHFQRSSHLEHPMAVPSTVVVQIQPKSERIHRPDLEMDSTADSVDADMMSMDTDGSIGSTRSNTPVSMTSSRSNLQSSIASDLDQKNPHKRGSNQSLTSITSSHYDALLGNLSDTSSLHDLTDSSKRKKPFITLEYSRRRPMKFLSPEDAAKPPNQPPAPPTSFFSSKVKEYPKEIPKPGTRVLGNLFGNADEVDYSGEYLTEGNDKPVKLRSPNTLKAISVYESRVDTKKNPVWYSFGSVVLAMRFRAEAKMLDVDILQVTDLPPGKENSKVDIQIRVQPGHRHRRSWIKGIEPGPRHDVDTFDAKAAIKVSKLTKRSFVATAFEKERKQYPHLALGHAVVPHLEAQDLMSGEWRVFPLEFRQGSELQDHLGMALVALSCCERIYGQYTFTVDVQHVRNVKVQRFGEGAVSSFKAKAELWVKAIVMVEGQTKKYEMSKTELMRPGGYDESQGWEAIYKRSCALSFNVPKNKVNLSSLVLQIHGKVRHNYLTKEAHLGNVQLGPDELFGGDNKAAISTTAAIRGPVNDSTDGGDVPTAPAAPIYMKDVPGDPLDPRLTQWGQSLRRMAKVEMWHRLQI